MSLTLSHKYQQRCGSMLNYQDFYMNNKISIFLVCFPFLTYSLNSLFLDCTYKANSMQYVINYENFLICITLKEICFDPIMSVKILPLAVLDKCIGTNIWILMKNDRQFAGTLRGFDDFFNMVLEQVIQTWTDKQKNGQKQKRDLDQILLNGHDIAFVNNSLYQMVPGVNPYKKQQPQKQK